jgi:hypothetical protein
VCAIQGFFNRSSLLTEFVFGEIVKCEDLDDDYSEIHYLVSTNLGAEKYCAAEMQVCFLKFVRTITMTRPTNKSLSDGSFCPR